MLLNSIPSCIRHIGL